MDYFAHGLWSYILFNKTKKPLYAILFGILPDTFSWLIYMFFRIFTGSLAFGKPNLNTIPAWMDTLYGLSHSLVIFSLVAVIVYLVYKKIPIYMWAWPIHILIDIPTHSRDFLPTPFLWPISNWAFPGISWGTSWLFISYWSLIIVSLIYILGKKKNWFKKSIVRKS
ncbi:hypothetical protein HOE37_02580 [Candidatus Woesearchaeota archaeon]|jgi:hypothetical protein|nr:hypothetical protein [Candidatus Woesearchaeota archaeon]MBT4110719.1 hypothetical protein [Candidatus Woesearchaeota archaeon]MBT4336315.1 hypothetical protein [Candidatus Woesearchaeota archaeon]MBT4469324.1 hypothetical protein [Candidatus Woesearchaeota archaeon]MBT6743853.1 hypothetical protein [Candidatus Woesearchaeota archaeon]